MTFLRVFFSMHVTQLAQLFYGVYLFENLKILFKGHILSDLELLGGEHTHTRTHTHP